ncbi:MAG: ATP-binding protein [Microthrixaceae bacterium]
MNDLLATVTLRRGADAPSAARRFISEKLSVAGAAGLVPDAALLVSELVTNAVLHTDGDDVQVDLATADGGRMRCTVIDGDPTHVPAVQTRDAARVGGQGLRIVDATARRWGVDVHDGRKAVWFELHSG